MCVCVCVCVSFFRLHRGEEGRVAASHSPEPNVPDRYRSEWAAPDGSMVARTLGVMAAAEERLQQPSPKRTRSEQPVSHRCLSGRQWVDVQRAARIASATNVKLTVHGIVIDGSAARQQQLTQQLQPQNQGTITVPSASQLAAPATSTSSTIVADAAPPRSPNARHRRSQRRLQDYQQTGQDRVGQAATVTTAAAPAAAEDASTRAALARRTCLLRGGDKPQL